MSLKQEENMDVPTYVSNHDAAYNDLLAVSTSEVDETPFIFMFIEKLKTNSYVQKELRMEIPDTLDKLYAKALQLSDSVSYGHSRSGGRPYRTYVPHVASSGGSQTHASSGPVPMELGAVQATKLPRLPDAEFKRLKSLQATRSRLTDSDKEFLTKIGGCWYCRERGHTVSTCSKKKKMVN